MLSSFIRELVSAPMWNFGIVVESFPNIIPTCCFPNTNTRGRVFSFFFFLFFCVVTSWFRVKVNLQSCEYLCTLDRTLCEDENALLSFEAIRSIHKQMDDDADGTVDAAETDEFLREDLKYHDPKAKHSNFHRADLRISVQDMWDAWKNSEVYNWTGEQVAEWLQLSVELPQYAESFRKHGLDGRALPRLAVKNATLTAGVLKILERSHAQKLQLKALDTVLFGPPAGRQNRWKDLVLGASILAALGGCWFAYVQTRRSRDDLGKLMKDLEGLQRAEQSLLDMQEKLQKAQEDQRCVQVEKVKVEAELRHEIDAAKQEARRLRQLREGAENERSRQKYAEEELEQVEGRRHRQFFFARWSVRSTFCCCCCCCASAAGEDGAEKGREGAGVAGRLVAAGRAADVAAADARGGSPVLQRQEAERREAAAASQGGGREDQEEEKFSVWHVSRGPQLLAGRRRPQDPFCQALADVTAALREKLHRWQNIENLTGFCLVSNPGLGALAAALNLDPSFLGLRPATPQHLLLSDDLDDMDEDILSPGTLKYAAWQMDRRVSDLWPLSGIADNQSPWKLSAPSLTPAQQRTVDSSTMFISQRDIMDRSDSDSPLPHPHSQSRSPYGSRTHLLSNRLPMRAGGGGGLEKSSSLGELRGISAAAVLASSCSTRSLCVASDGAARVPAAAAGWSPAEDAREEGGEASGGGGRRRNAFNKIFKKKK
ncbi:stromal interaction molecule 1-like isoform X2 [Festucalex cinctus]